MSIAIAITAAQGRVEEYLLQHKETKLIYSSVSLEEGRKQEDYIEIKDESPKPEME